MTARSVADLVADTTARGAVLRQLADAFDRHATYAQLAKGEGRETEARRQARIADRLLRAWKAESRRPEPRS